VSALSILSIYNSGKQSVLFLIDSHFFLQKNEKSEDDNPMLRLYFIFFASSPFSFSRDKEKEMKRRQEKG